MKRTPFELQPTLNGRLLRLRPLRADDFDALYACASDPLVWEQHPQSDRYKREVFQIFFEGALGSRGALVATDVATGAVIGSSRFYDVRAGESRVTVGYTFLTRKHWGGLFNREMKSLMLRHAFQFVDTVFFEIGERNLRSQRAIERIGAQRVGTMKGDGWPQVIYSIDEAGFLEGLR